MPPATRPIDDTSDALRDLVIRSAKRGGDFDLTNIGYGTPHWVSDRAYITDPSAYYFFLAGLVNVTGSHRIVEIGTHCGGTIKSMLRGIRPDLRPDVVTIDLTDVATDIRKVPGVVKLTGDSNSEIIIEQTCEHFKNDPIDLLFIDADHRYAPTVASFLIYTNLLKPRYAVLDDINLNHGMSGAWKRICQLFPGCAVNAAKIVPSVRPAEPVREGPDEPEKWSDPGIGIVMCR